CVAANRRTTVGAKHRELQKYLARDDSSAKSCNVRFELSGKVSRAPTAPYSKTIPGVAEAVAEKVGRKAASSAGSADAMHAGGQECPPHTSFSRGLKPY